MSIASNSSAAETVMVPLGRIPIDEGAQMRVKMGGGVVWDYAAAMCGLAADALEPGWVREFGAGGE
jgi:hypothetical protein